MGRSVPFTKSIVVDPRPPVSGPSASCQLRHIFQDRSRDKLSGTIELPKGAYYTAVPTWRISRPKTNIHDDHELKSLPCCRDNKRYGKVDMFVFISQIGINCKADKTYRGPEWLCYILLAELLSWSTTSSWFRGKVCFEIRRIDRFRSDILFQVKYDSQNGLRRSPRKRRLRSWRMWRSWCLPVEHECVTS
jgi:hypothetical protein